MEGRDHVAVFAAHPDDEGAAWATLEKYHRYKNEVSIIWLTTGGRFIAPLRKYAHYLPLLVKAAYSKKIREKLERRIITIRKREALNAAKILKATPYFLEFKDTGIPDHNDLATVRQVTNLIRKIRPTIILTHFFREGHRDHKNTSALVSRSVLLAKDKEFRTEYPPHKVRVLGYWNERGRGFKANFHINVEHEIDEVKKWGRKYISQGFRIVGRLAKVIARFNSRKTPYSYVENYWIFGRKLIKNYGEFFP
jgi:LmbE family N-acetylglucosaminyl deacetylase